jgi:hypothetical protein
MVFYVWSSLLAGAIASILIGLVTTRDIGKALLLAGFITITPILFIWLIIDYRNVRRVAEELEPVDTATYQPKNVFDAMLQALLLYVVRPIVIFVALPCLVILGGVLMLITDSDKSDGNNDTIW